MRTKATLLSTLLLATALNAQTTALNFTANDCDGAPHDLFTELDAGNVVIIELVMMGCQPCITAGNSIKNNVLPNTSDPSRVKFYSIGFTNSITCTQMNNWKTTNGFTHTVFAGMSAQTTHYNGMGMPTLAIVGGADHTVYYTELGHSASDNPTIIAAIESALSAGVGINESNDGQVINVFPNPVNDQIQLNGDFVSARLIDALGRVSLEVALQGKNTLDATGIDPGQYTLQLIGQDNTLYSGRFVKQ